MEGWYRADHDQRHGNGDPGRRGGARLRPFLSSGSIPRAPDRRKRAGAGDLSRGVDRPSRLDSHQRVVERRHDRRNQNSRAGRFGPPILTAPRVRHLAGALTLRCRSPSNQFHQARTAIVSRAAIMAAASVPPTIVRNRGPPSISATVIFTNVFAATPMAIARAAVSRPPLGRPPWSSKTSRHRRRSGRARQPSRACLRRPTVPGQCRQS